MASKMLVNRVTRAVFCVRCANETEAMVDQAQDLEHVTTIGDERCNVCGEAILALPEPPTYRYDVAVTIAALFGIDAASPIEVEAIVKRIFCSVGSGVVSMQFVWHDTQIVE